AVAAGCDAHPLQLFSLFRQASRFDVVHAHDARAHTLASLAPTPFVVSRRVAFPLKRTPVSRFKYARPACFLAVSQYVGDVLVEAGIPPGKIAVVYDGVPLPERVSFNDRTRIIALDSGDPRKGKTIIEQASRTSQIPVYFSRSLVRDLREAALFVYIT